VSAFANIKKRVPEGMHFQYIMALRHGRTNHMWALSNKAGAIHISGWQHEWDGRAEWLGGVECHWPSAPEWARNDKPSHDHCWLLEGPCWHDGSSLYFSEQLAPYLERCSADDAMPQHIHNLMLGTLLEWHSDKFADREAA
jgi:hypothetical protein